MPSLQRTLAASPAGSGLGRLQPEGTDFRARDNSKGSPYLGIHSLDLLCFLRRSHAGLRMAFMDIECASTGYCLSQGRLIPIVPTATTCRGIQCPMYGHFAFSFKPLRLLVNLLLSTPCSSPCLGAVATDCPRPRLVPPRCDFTVSSSFLFSSYRSKFVIFLS